MLKEKQHSLRTIKNAGAKKADIAMLIVLVLFFLYYFFSVRRGVNAVDEAFYYTIPMRIFKGDGFLSTEWHVSQFSSIFQLIPYRLFTLITSSTDGIIMFFRGLYIIFQLTTAVFLYFHVRKYKFAGVFCTALFCFFVPVNIMTPNYYTMFAMSCVVLACILFLEENHGTPKLIFCGFLFACNVLIEPLMIFIWVIYSVIVLVRKIRKKETDKENILSSRKWLRTFIGAAICFVIFVIILLSTSRIEDIIKTIPEMFTDSEYVPDVGTGTILNYSKIFDAVSFFGTVPPVIALLLFAVLFADRKNIIKRRSIYLVSASLLLTAALVVFSVVLTRRNYAQAIMNYILIPFYFYGILCYMLTSEKNGRLLAFWVYGVLCAVFMDISSEISFGFGGMTAVLASALMAGELFNELKSVNNVKTEKKSKNKSVPAKKSFMAIISIFCAVAVVTGSEMYLAARSFQVKNVENYFMRSEEKLDSEIDFGPLKGIKTTPEVNNYLNLYKKDLDAVKENSDDGVYILSLNAWMYLYLDMPVSAYSAWFVQADYPGRQIRYWQMYPEKIPGYIYIPKLSCFTYTDLGNADKDLEALKEFCECEVTESDVGYIVKVLDMNI